MEQANLISDPLGHVWRVTFNAPTGHLFTDAAAYGTSLARTTTLTRNTNNQVSRETDGFGSYTDYSYDLAGNMTIVTRLTGTGDAVTTSYTYDATLNLLTSVTDPLITTTLTRDTLRNVTAVIDPLNHQMTFT